MRLSVECVFPYLGKHLFVSRKSAFWLRPLTEKRILTYTCYQRLGRHTCQRPTCAANAPASTVSPRRAALISCDANPSN